MIAEKQQETKNSVLSISRILLFAGLGYILTRAVFDFYDIAWGSGTWLGQFSLKWAIGFFLFSLFCIIAWAIAASVLWKQQPLVAWLARLATFRDRLGYARWPVVLGLLVLPVWFLQCTPWGVVFRGIYFRSFIWIFSALGIAIFLHVGRDLLNWPSMLVALLLTSSAFSVAAALINVSDYPFSLGWSEGNRMWDYSVMFGRHLYDYPPGKEMIVLLDVGRQFIGGLPFLFSDVSIWSERFWAGLTTIFPYLLLGFAAFRMEARDAKRWVLLAFWAFIFLKQGPIHPPLVICAFVVALLWRGPLWAGIPLIVATGYFAEESRFTWLFAPAIWIVMLELAGAKLENRRIPKRAWWRASTLGFAGAVGGYFVPMLAGWLRGPAADGGVSVEAVATSVTVQPLLWYRLFPNATYGIGILLALLVAVAPTLALLFYLTLSKKWTLGTWQKLALILPSLAFLGVGLVVSTKIGGGGDLHNMDMFLIGIFFSAVIAWEKGGRQWLSQIGGSSPWIKGVLALLLVIPGLQPLSMLRGFDFAQDVPWLVTLTDVSDGKFLEMLPPDDEVTDILQTIRREVDARKSQGEVLFMDQRQLLTFGYVKDVPFVPDYEKKMLMNEAMSGNAAYFAPFYADLAAKRFSLIISEPLRAPVKDSNFEFGEENNAWVKWVVEPTLCYYEEIETFKSAQIQLLVPKQGNVDCSGAPPVQPAAVE